MTDTYVKLEPVTQRAVSQYKQKLVGGINLEAKDALAEFEIREQWNRKLIRLTNSQSENRFLEKISHRFLENGQGNALGYYPEGILLRRTKGERTPEGSFSTKEYPYKLLREEFDWAISYEKLNEYASSKDFVKNLSADMAKKIAIDRVTVAWQGKEEEATEAKPRLVGTEINDGWIEYVRKAEDQNVLSEPRFYGEEERIALKGPVKRYGNESVVGLPTEETHKLPAGLQVTIKGSDNYSGMFRLEEAPAAEPIPENYLFIEAGHTDEDVSAAFATSLPDAKNLDSLVNFLQSEIPEHFRHNLKVFAGSKVRMGHRARMFTLFEKPTEKQAASKFGYFDSVGGLPLIDTPGMAENTLVISAFDNLAIYHQKRSRRKVTDNSNLSSVSFWNTFWSDYVVENPEAFIAVEGVYAL